MHLLVAPSWLLRPISFNLPSIHSSSSQIQWMALCFIWIRTSIFWARWILLQTFLLYYDWNLFSTRKLCSSCLRSNYFTSLIISFPWRKRVNQSGHQGLLSRCLWSPRRPSLGGTGTVEVKICYGVWGLKLMLCCWYLVATSYFSMFCRRFSVQSQLKFG